MSGESGLVVAAHHSVPWRRIAVFAAVACGLAWVAALPLYLDPRHLESPIAGAVLPAMMFTPLLAAFVVILRDPKATRIPIRDQLGLRPTAPWRSTVGASLTGILLLPLLIVGGIVLAVAFGFVHLDLVGFSSYAAELERTTGDARPWLVRTVVWVQIAIIPVAAVLNGVLAFGEEAAWRGWLLPKLLPLGAWPAVLLSGALWGLWHAPIILLGYDFDQPNLFGVTLMVVACTLIGAVLCALRLWGGSVWPAVFAHGALNASGGLVGLLLERGTSVDLVLAGPLGLTTCAVTLLLIVVVLTLRRWARRGPGREARQPTSASLTSHKRSA